MIPIRLKLRMLFILQILWVLTVQLERWILQAELRKRSADEQKEEIEQGRTKTSKTTLVYRNVKRNPDILLLILVILTCVALGYCIARVKFGVTAEQIKTGIGDFVSILGAIIAAIIAVIGKLHTAQGPISKAMSGTANKDESQLDQWGRTIVK